MQIKVEERIHSEADSLMQNPRKKSKKQKYLNPPPAQVNVEEEERKALVIPFTEENAQAAYMEDDLFYSSMASGKEKSIRISMCEMEFEGEEGDPNSEFSGHIGEDWAHEELDR